MNQVIFVGISGGSASGKSTIAQKIVRAFQKHVVLINQDSYYKELDHLSIEERKKINFDHPDSIDIELLLNDLNLLKQGKSINKPVYDFTRYTRSKQWQPIASQRIIIVDGILIFAIPEIRSFFDVKLFVDTDSDERLLRRINRDLVERKRTFESIKKQYLETVKPMYLEFVEPSKRYADIIIPRGGNNLIAINLVISKLKSLLTDS